MHAMLWNAHDRLDGFLLAPASLNQVDFLRRRRLLLIDGASVGGFDVVGKRREGRANGLRQGAEGGSS